MMLNVPTFLTFTVVDSVDVSTGVPYPPLPDEPRWMPAASVTSRSQSPMMPLTVTLSLPAAGALNGFESKLFGTVCGQTSYALVPAAFVGSGAGAVAVYDFL